MPASEDTIIGDLAVERGHATREQVSECLANQKAMSDMGITQSLGEILVAKNHITRGQLRDLLREERKRSGRQIKIGNYAVEAKLGEGGMGAVYKARLGDTGAVVALKVLPPEMAKNREFVARFRREAELASRLDHPNIVRAIEAGETGGYHYFVMEYVEGRSVGDRLKEDGAFSETDALDIIRQMALALDHAHSAGLVHRDIKPDNIFADDAGGAKLGDLGLARDSADDDATRITQAGMMVGTPHYVSPEQATGNWHIDTRADIYSLGASLFHMLTGEVPFKGETSLEVLNQHLYDPLPWPADFNPDISEGTCLLIAKMMAKEPGDRYQTPEELIRDLMPVIAGGLPTSVKRGASASGRKGARASRRSKATAGATTVQAARRRTTTKSRRSSAAIEAARGSKSQMTWLIAAGSAALILVAAVIAFSGSDDAPGPRPRPRPEKVPEPKVVEAPTPEPVRPDPPKSEPPRAEPPRQLAPAVVGEARFGNGSVRQLGGGRVEVVWEFDKPLDEDAWYLKNILPGNSGGGSLVMDNSSIWPCFGRAMAPRASFEGDLEVEATFSSREGYYTDGPRLPGPSATIYTAEPQANGRRRSVGLTAPWGDNIGRWAPVDRTDRAWPIGYALDNPDCTLKLVRRGTMVERFYSLSPGNAKFEKVGSAYLPPGPAALDIGLNHGYCTASKTKLERVRIVGRPCGGLALPHPGEAVPKKPSAAQQLSHAQAIAAKDKQGPEARAAYCAQIVHYPRSIDQIGGSGAFIILANYGNPGDVVAAWRKIGGNFTESQALNSNCLLYVGKSYAYMGDPKKALTILRKGRDTHCYYGEALADIHRAMGRHDEALAELERIIEKWPRFWAVSRFVVKIGHVHRAKGETEKALARYREVIAKWPQYERYAGEAKKAIAEIEAGSKSTPGAEAPKSTGEIDFGGADVKALGGGRYEIVWEFDGPLAKDAWYLWNVLPDDSGGGHVKMAHRRSHGSACHVSRSMIPRVAFKGDIEVEMSLTGISGVMRGRKSSPLPSLSLASLEHNGPGPRPAVRAFNQVTYGFIGKRWGPTTQGGIRWPGNLSVGTEVNMKLIRRGTEVEFFFGAPGALKSVGRSTFPPELIGVDAALQHRWCTRYDAHLSRLRIVGTPAGTLDLPDPAMSVPRMATAAEQVAHAKSVKDRSSFESISAWRAVPLYHPRAGKQILEAMGALGNYGAPAEVLRIGTAAAALLAADASLRSTAERRVASAYLHLGRKDEAVRCLSKDHKPSALSSWGLVSAFYMYDDFDEAIAEAERLIAKWPNDYRAPGSQLLIGDSWRAKGDREKALGAYRRMLAKWPKDSRCSKAQKAIAEIEAEGN